MTTSAQYGAGAVPVDATAPAAWLQRNSSHPSKQDELRQRWVPPGVPPSPRDVVEAARIAALPLRHPVTVLVLGLEGGAGRTTVTRLLGRACRSVRDDTVVAIDAVPLWGGLTAAVNDPVHRGLTVQEFADLPWPPRMPGGQFLQATLTPDAGVPTLTGASADRGGWADLDAIEAAIHRAATIAGVTIVDTVADPAGWPASDLMCPQRAMPVWVCNATRAGLWGVAEAIGYFGRLGVKNLAARSVVAVVSHRRRWPADAAATEVQLTGAGLDFIRIPHARNPLDSVRCAHAAVQLLAAVVRRAKSV